MRISICKKFRLYPYRGIKVSIFYNRASNYAIFTHLTHVFELEMAYFKSHFIIKFYSNLLLHYVATPKISQYSYLLSASL